MVFRLTDQYPIKHKQSNIGKISKLTETQAVLKRANLQKKSAKMTVKVETLQKK